MAFTVQSLKNKNDTYHKMLFLNTWLKTRENQSKIEKIAGKNEIPTRNRR